MILVLHDGVALELLGREVRAVAVAVPADAALLVRDGERSALGVEVERRRLVQVLVGVVGQHPRRERARLLVVVDWEIKKGVMVGLNLSLEPQ